MQDFSVSDVQSYADLEDLVYSDDDNSDDDDDGDECNIKQSETVDEKEVSHVTCCKQIQLSIFRWREPHWHKLLFAKKFTVQ